jgi:ATP-dependent helicase/nuclease subunit B
MIGDYESMIAMPPRVFTIPPSAPFLPTLIEALWNGRLGFRPAADPLALAAVTLYLPTRRACGLARDCFLDAMKADAAILPRIVAIGDTRSRYHPRSAAWNAVCC